MSLDFGAAPALLLFAPWQLLTESSLRHAWGVALACGIAFLAAAWLLADIRRRHFPRTADGWLAALILAAAFTSGLPLMLQRADFWEVAIAYGQAMVMVSLVCLWRAMHQAGRLRWLAVASAAYGLAVASRPSLAPGAGILLVPVAWAWTRERARAASLAATLVASLAPLAGCVAALLAFNRLRFGNALEFGVSYQLNADPPAAAAGHFGLTFVWTNLRIYFWQPTHWGASFPFVRSSATPSLPAGHGMVENCYGAALGLPFLWLAFGASLVWRKRADGAASELAYLVSAIGWLFLSNAAVLCPFYCCCLRYEVELLAPLSLLAAIGSLAFIARWEGSRRRRWAAPAIIAVLAGFSVAFAALAAVHLHVSQLDFLAEARLTQGNLRGASQAFEQAIALEPGNPQAAIQLSMKLLAERRDEPGLSLLRRSVELNPGDANLENAFGVALGRLGRPAEAAVHFDRAVRLSPGFALARHNLAAALAASR